MKPIAVFLLCAALSVGWVAHAVNWVKLDSLSTDDIAFYVDFSSLRHDNEEAISLVKTVLKSGTVAFERTDNCTSGTAYLSAKRVYDTTGKLIEKSAEIITLPPPQQGADKTLQEYICAAAGFPKLQAQSSSAQ